MVLRAHVKDSIEPRRPRPTTGATNLPPARMLRIEESEGGFFLLRLTSDGQFAGDTWHESVRDAQLQAEFEFGVTPREWQDEGPERK